MKMRRAGPESFIRPFLDPGLQSAPLLTLVLHTENLAAEPQSFVKEILRLVGHANGGQKPLPKDELMALSAAASISPREQEVLRLVSAGLSNREIAARFFYLSQHGQDPPGKYLPQAGREQPDASHRASAGAQVGANVGALRWGKIQRPCPFCGIMVLNRRMMRGEGCPSDSGRKFSARRVFLLAKT